MAREVKIGILVSVAATGAVKALQGIGSAASGTSNVASKAFGAMKMNVIALNQAVALGRRAWAAVSGAMDETIGTALKFRRSGDPVLEWFKEAKRESELLKARVGDALIPVFMGFAKAGQSVTKELTNLVVKNREIIGSKLVEWTVKVGTGLTRGIATGVLMAARAWLGWKMIVDGFTGVVDKAFGGILSGVSSAIKGFAELARMTGAGGIATSAAAAAESVGMLAQEFSRAGDSSFDAVSESAAELDAMEKKVRAVEDALVSGIERAGVGAMREVKNATIGVNTSLDDQKKLFDDLAKSEEDYQKNLRTLSNITIKSRREAAHKLKEDEDKANQKRIEAATGVTEVVGGLASDLTSLLTSEHKKLTANERAEATAQVLIKTAVAIAGAIAAGADKNWPLNLIAIASGVAAVVGAFAQIASFADGGFVTGGRRGRDSVPAMLMPGEYVMNNREVANGAPSWAGGGTTINNFMWQPDSVGMARMTRRQARSMRNLQKRGMLKLAPAGG